MQEKFYPPIMLISVNRLFPHELKQLKIIIKNHSLNPNEPVSRLFDYIAARYPKIEEKDITPEVIHKKIFRGSIFDRQKVWKVVTIFNRFVEKLLIESELEIDESLSNLLLKRAMRKRKFRGRFYSIKSRNHKDIFDKFVTDTGTYANMYKTQQESFEYYHLQKYNNIFSVFESKTVILDYYIAFEKLRNYYDHIVCASFTPGSSKVKKNFFEDVTGFVRDNKKAVRRYHPWIYLYYLLAEFYENYDDRYMSELVKYKKKYENKFTPELLNHYRDAIITISLKAINEKKGNALDHHRKLFFEFDRVYMKKEEQFKSTFTENEFRSFNFLNPVYTGLALGKLDWVKKFIDKYRNLMSDKYDESAYNIAMAVFHFHKKNYTESLAFSSKTGIAPGHHDRLARINKLCCSYELRETLLMNSALHNFRQHLKRKKNMNDQVRKRFGNFIRIFSALVEIRDKYMFTKNGRAQAAVLKAEINKITDFLNNRAWFLKKLDEMGG